MTLFNKKTKRFSNTKKMKTNRQTRIGSLNCPECGEVGTLRKIIYGMPDPEVFDFEKYAVGGCCITGDGSDPDVQCNECGWEGMQVSITQN